MSKFFKTFVSLTLALVMSLSLVLLAACSEEGADANSANSGNEQSVTSQSDGGNSSTGEGGNVDPVDPVEPTPSYNAQDRSEYTVANAAERYLDSSVYDLIVTSQGEGLTAMLDGYLVGDLYNQAVTLAFAASYEGEEVPQILKLFNFGRSVEGKWYNYYGGEVHPILAKLLNCGLADPEVGLSEEDLENYADTTLLSIVKYSLTNADADKLSSSDKQNIEMMLDGFATAYGGALSATLTATIPDVVALLEGDMNGFAAVYGQLKANEMFPGMELPEYMQGVTVSQLFALIGGDTQVAVELFGDLTLGELAGGGIPEELMDNPYIERLLSVTVSQFMAMEDGEVDSGEFFLELFGDLYFGDLWSDPDQAPEGFAEMTINELLAMVENYVGVFIEGDEKAIYDAFGGYIFDGEYVPEFLAGRSLADVMMLVKEITDGVNEYGAEEYAMQLLESGWAEIKDMTLSQLAEMAGEEMPEALEEYTEMTLEELFTKIMATVEEMRNAEGGEPEEEGAEAITAKEIMGILSELVICTKTEYDDQSGESREMTLTAIEAVYLLESLVNNIAEAEKADPDHPVAAFFSGWSNFLATGDDFITFWLDAMDEQYAIVIGTEVYQATVWDPETGDEMGYEEVEEPKYLSLSEEYENVKNYVAIANSVLTYMTYKDAMKIFGSYYQLPDYSDVVTQTGLPSIDAFTTELLDTTIIEVIENSKLWEDKLGDAVLAVTFGQVVTAIGIPEEGAPKEYLALTENYGGFTIVDFINMDKEAAALCSDRFVAFADWVKAAAVYAALNSYDLGNKAMSDFAYKIATVSFKATDAEVEETIVEALKGIKLQDVIECLIKISASVQ